MKKLIVRMLRGIKNAKGQFISIVAIIAVGSLMFAGMFGAQRTATSSVENYYAEQNLADVWCYFKGISQDEIDDLSNNDSILSAEGRYVYSAKLMVNNTESELLIRSMTGINACFLTQGAFPASLNEITVDNEYAKDNHLEPGSMLTIHTDNGDVTLTITGLVSNPEAIVVRKDAAANVSHREFGVAYATDETLIGLNRTTTLYLDMQSELMQKAEDAQNELDDAAQKLTDGQIEYDKTKKDAETQLADAQNTLADASRRISDGRAELDTQKQDAIVLLNDTQAKIDDAWASLDEAKTQGEVDLATAQIQLDDAKKKINDAQSELNKQERDARWKFDDAQAQINDAQRQLDDKRRTGEAELAAAQLSLDDAKQKIDAGQAELDQQKRDAQLQLDEAQAKIDAAQTQLDAKRQQGEAELAAAQQKLDDLARQIREGESGIKSLKSGNSPELAALQGQIDEARRQLDASEGQLNAEYAALTPEEQEEREAEFTAQFDRLEQERATLNSRQNDLDSQIAGAQAAIPELEAQLAEAKSSYDQGATELAAKKSKVEAELAAAQTEINNQQKLLNDQLRQGQVKLSEAESQLSEAKANYNAALQEFTKKKADGEAQFIIAQAEIDSKQKQLDDEWKKGQIQLADAQKQIDDAKISYAEGLNEFNTKKAEGEQKLTEAEAEIVSNQRQLDDKWQEGQQTIAEAEAKLTDAQRSYNEGLAEFSEKKADAQMQLSDAAAQLSDGQRTLAGKNAEFISIKADAEAELEATLLKYPEVLFKTNDPEAVKALVAENKNYVIALGRTENLSYMMVDNSLAPLQSLALVFPIIFFLVAAVIGFISISKMVETQRTHIAIMQAIGISKNKIRLSFLSYPLAASALGSIAFAAIGNIIVPGYLIQAFTNKFDMPPMSVPMYPLYMLLPMLIAFLFTGAAALLAVQKTLKEVPAQGMRPRPPKSAKETLVERFSPIWNRLSSSGRLICRSMLRNKGRILMSSIGVVGSAALLMAGFSLQNSANAVISTVVQGVDYEVSVGYDEPITDKLALIFPYDVESVELTAAKRATLDLGAGEIIRVQFVETGSVLMNIFDEQDNKLAVFCNSVYIPQNLAQNYSITPGDAISMEIGNESYDFIVSGISQQYLAKSLYISFDAAEAAGLRLDSTTALLKLTNPNEAAPLADALRTSSEVTGVSTKQEKIDEANAIMTMLNAVILVIIIAAAALAVTVIYNITSVNILERTREYATLMVLGHPKKQINRLISAENAVLTIIGCLIGIPLGYVLFNYLAGVVSRGDMTLGNNVSMMAMLMAALMSAAFMIISNLLVRPKVSRISLVETLKGIE